MPYIKFAITSIIVMVSVEGKSEKKKHSIEKRKKGNIGFFFNFFFREFLFW